MYKLGPWSLAELATDPKGDEFRQKIQDLEQHVAKFEKIKLSPNISSTKFTNVLDDLADINYEINKIVGYAHLAYAADTQSDEATSLLTQMSMLGSDIANKILFFGLWWKRLDKKNAGRLIKNAGNLQEYLNHKRRIAKYTLSEPEEKIINTLDVTGASALVKLYDKITNAFEYQMKIKSKTLKMTREELVNYVRSNNANIRRNAYRTMLTKYDQNRGVLGEIYQNIVLNWRDEGLKIRGYDSPIAMRNIANNIDDETIESLLETCKRNKTVFQQFFIQKAKLLKMKHLRRYDIYAPISRSDKHQYSYDTAVKLVLESFGRFSDTLKEYARNVFEQNHVDSEIRHGKRDGAFCSTLGPDLTPFVLLNFTGQTRDVFTLAHEIGHAIHSQAAQNNSILVQDAPLPISETASTFGELLLYQNISEHVPDKQKAVMLAEKIDDLYATIMRQAFFTIFEVKAHDQIDKGSTVKQISDAYVDNIKSQFGSAVDVSDDFAAEWLCIPHFFHTPFYCYAYSFGNLLALSLFQRYMKEGRDFVPSYIEILAAGGSQKPEELLSKYGFDIHSSKFWQQGFDYVKTQVKTLESLRG